MSIYAVNGKEPVAAWIPSLDTAGNGTTTLTDLVGSNNGTLTNMDAATDWVADTDAGGVRALDFDGVNDFIHLGYQSALNLPAPLSFSLWAIVNEVRGQSAFFSNMGAGFAGWEVSITLRQWRFWNGASWATVPVSSNITIGDWHHVVITNNGTTTAIYINGVLVLSTAHSGPTSNPATPQTIGARSNQIHFPGRADDIRVSNVALDATDVAALYAGGLGRGITFGGVDKWALLRRGNRMGHRGVMSSPNQHIARGIRMAQMGITI